MIEQGRFRLDLFYRLRGVTILLPPLRERTEDIPELAHYFLFRYNRDLGTAVGSIAEETLERLQYYSWPGNIRELQSVIREALLRSAGPVLLPEFLPEHIGREATAANLDSLPTGSITWESLAAHVHDELTRGQPGVYRRALEQLDHLLVNGAMTCTCAAAKPPQPNCSA